MKEKKYNIVSADMYDMHQQFGVHEVVNSFDTEKLRKFLQFRLDFLQEEKDEGQKSLDESNPDDFVDSMVDLVVIAVGTLDLMGVDFDEAWERVRIANCSKKAGVNPTRPNELGLPDLIKPENFVAPSHEGNHGLLDKLSS